MFSFIFISFYCFNEIYETVTAENVILIFLKCYWLFWNRYNTRLCLWIWLGYLAYHWLASMWGIFQNSVTNLRTMHSLCFWKRIMIFDTRLLMDQRLQNRFNNSNKIDFINKLDSSFSFFFSQNSSIQFWTSSIGFCVHTTVFLIAL